MTNPPDTSETFTGERRILGMTRREVLLALKVAAVFALVGAWLIMMYAEPMCCEVVE